MGGKLIKVKADEYIFIWYNKANQKYIYIDTFEKTIKQMREKFGLEWDDIRGAFYHLKKPIDNVSVLGMDGTYLYSYKALREEFEDEYQDASLSSMWDFFGSE